MEKKSTKGGFSRFHWSSWFTFVLAASGSAVGLGNIWKFPYVTGENGGFFFIVTYIFCVFTIGIPIFIAELYIGQRSQSNVIKAFEVLHNKKSPWRIIGVFSILSSFVILSFYNVVGAWILDFEFRSLSLEFSRLSEGNIKNLLTSILQSPFRQIVFHTIFSLICLRIVYLDMSSGIEKWNKILMPSLFVILFGLFIYSFFLTGSKEAFQFIFLPKIKDFSSRTFLEGLGQAFFSLSLGMGCILTYGSYLSKKVNIIKTTLIVVFFDTLVALLMGVIIFSIVFSFGLQPGEGPGLIFSTLPTLFSKMFAGSFVSVIFFMLVLFAAVTSSISILEILTAYFTEQYKKSRKTVVFYLGIVVLLSGWFTIFSFNKLSFIQILGLSVFDFQDKFLSNVLLPLGGVLVSLFFGWVIGRKAINQIFPASFPSLLKESFLWVTRILAPFFVLLVVFYHLFLT